MCVCVCDPGVCKYCGSTPTHILLVDINDPTDSSHSTHFHGPQTYTMNLYYFFD